MTKTKLTPQTQAAPSTNTELVKKEATAISAPLIQQASIQVTTPDAYMEASLIRAKLKDSSKAIADRVDKIIRPAYEALQQLYAFKKELISPIDKAADALTEQMRQFKLEEARQLQAAEDAKRREEERLEREIQAKLKAAEAAKTPQMQARMQAQAGRVAEQAQRVAEAPIAAPVRAVGSTTRKFKRVEVVDFMALVKGVAAGEVPEDVLMVDESRMNEYLKLDAGAVAEMPGINVVEDLRVVGR